MNLIDRWQLEHPKDDDNFIRGIKREVVVFIEPGY